MNVNSHEDRLSVHQLMNGLTNVVHTINYLLLLFSR